MRSFTLSTACRIPPDATMEEAEKLLIFAALDATGGNKKEAAARLGIGQATLYRKLAHYQDVPRKSEGA